jgi:hypothetical protein
MSRSIGNDVGWRNTDCPCYDGPINRGGEGEGGREASKREATNGQGWVDQTCAKDDTCTSRCARFVPLTM